MATCGVHRRVQLPAKHRYSTADSTFCADRTERRRILWVQRGVAQEASGWRVQSKPAEHIVSNECRNIIILICVNPCFCSRTF